MALSKHVKYRMRLRRERLARREKRELASATRSHMYKLGLWDPWGDAYNFMTETQNDYGEVLFPTITV